MSVDMKTLEAKILEMYPEITKNGVQTEVTEDSGSDAYLFKMIKGSNTETTHLEKKDVEDCLNGVKCVHLGVQVGRFINDYCRSDSCDT